MNTSSTILQLQQLYLFVGLLISFLNLVLNTAALFMALERGKHLLVKWLAPACVAHVLTVVYLCWTILFRFLRLRQTVGTTEFALAWEAITGLIALFATYRLFISVRELIADRPPA